MHNHNIHKHTTSTIISLLTVLTFASGVILTSPKASADSSVGVTVSVTVPAVCSLTANSDSVSNTIYPGNDGLIGTTNIKAICNDPSGLAVYAVGYTNNTYGNTDLESTVGGTTNTIGTNATASGTPAQSEWHMTLTQVSGDYVPTIVTGFGSAHAIPSAYTKVAYRDTMTDMGSNATGANFTASFNAYIANDQAAGTYTGKVKFLLVHPNSNIVAPETLYTMQNVAQWGHNVGLGETVTAVDVRDGEEYTVARLADNKLWMTKNLRLNIATASITADNTNNPSSTFLTDAADPEKNAAETSPWCYTSDGTCVDQIRYSTISIGDDTVDQEGHTYDEYGIYYNWYTATAGNGTYDSDYGFTAPGDICPSGWRLPTGTNDNNEFVALDIAMGGNGQSQMTTTNGERVERWINNPVNMVLGGYYHTSYGLNDIGTSGNYHTASASSHNNEYTLGLSKGIGYNNNTYYSLSIGGSVKNKYEGLAVRCVADPPYLQDVANWGGSVALEETIEAMDKRDGQIYKVKRLKMNAAGTETALWMSNLNLGAQAFASGVTELNSTNTNLASGVTAISANDFMNWDRTISGNGFSYTNPKFTPISTTNSSNDQAEDSYGNKYGTLYNFAAASAGTYTYGRTGGNGIVSSDLCPSGWRMPTSGSTGEFKALSDSYDLSTDWSPAEFTLAQQGLGFSLAGRFGDGAPDTQGTFGLYWSSTWLSTVYRSMYVFYIHATFFSPMQEFDRNLGAPLRCIAQ